MCLLCSNPNEKASQMLTCSDAGATRAAATLHSLTLHDHLQEIDAHPDLLLSIPKMLGKIQVRTPIHFSVCPRSLHPALWAQAAIRWTDFLIGCWSVEQLRLQQRHLQGHWQSEIGPLMAHINTEDGSFRNSDTRGIITTNAFKAKVAPQ